MTDCVIITTSLSSREAARRMAAMLVEERLAACVQVGEIESCYRWQGAVERAGEWLLSAKTTAARAPEVQARIAASHDHDLPEIIIFPISGGFSPYLEWITEMVRPFSGEEQEKQRL